MKNRKDVTVPLPGDTVDRIDDLLEYGDSRAGWIRQAVHERLEREREEGVEEGNPTTAAVSQS